jgi:hypothetical protein
MLKFVSTYKEKIYSFFIYLIVFLSSIFPAADKDAGWHYKYGEYFFLHGKILTQDIFSWTMSGYAWVNHSWLYDLIFYTLSKNSGLIGLSIVGGLINFLAFYFIVFNFRLSYWKKAILGFFFILLGETGIMFGLRSQVVSLLFFAILMTIIIRAKNNFKFLFYLPILFFIWANFHGDFTLGLGIVGIFLFCYFCNDFIKTAKFPKKLFAVYSLSLLFSFLLSLLNPFGFGVYSESFNHFYNPYLKYIYEWKPIYNNCSYCHTATFGIYSLLLLVALIIFIKQKKSFAIPYLFLFCLFLLPAIETRRFLPIFCVTTLPFFAGVLEDIKWDFRKLKMSNYLTILIIIVGLEFNLYNRFVNYNLYNFNEYDYCYFASGCSPIAVNYLVSHPPKGKGFNFYNWGGYLIGKNIQTKLFIDGRMDLWKMNGYSAFGDFISIYYYKNYKKFIQYDFNWALIEDSSDLARELYSTQDLGTWRLTFRDGRTDYFVKIK